MAFRRPLTRVLVFSSSLTIRQLWVIRGQSKCAFSLVGGGNRRSRLGTDRNGNNLEGANARCGMRGAALFVSKKRESAMKPAYRARWLAFLVAFRCAFSYFFTAFRCFLADFFNIFCCFLAAARDWRAFSSTLTR